MINPLKELDSKYNEYITVDRLGEIINILHTLDLSSEDLHFYKKKINELMKIHSDKAAFAARVIKENGKWLGLYNTFHSHVREYNKISL